MYCTLGGALCPKTKEEYSKCCSFCDFKSSCSYVCDDIEEWCEQFTKENPNKGNVDKGKLTGTYLGIPINMELTSNQIKLIIELLKIKDL